MVVQDRFSGAGGLAGVEAALRAAGGDVVVVAWDMPFVTAELVALLIAEAQKHAAAIVVPESESPHGFEPFCAFYSSQVLPALTAFLENGGGAAHEFLDSVAGVRRIPRSRIAKLGSEPLFFSINTPDDLEHARAIASAL